MSPAMRPRFALRGLAAMAALGLGLLALPAAAADYTIVINDMQFGPVPAVLHPGDTLTWRNDDIFRHTATARDNSFDIDLPAGAEASMVVGPPGKVAFYCRFHPGMTGTLVITP